MRKKEHVPDYVKKSASYQARAAAGKPKKINIKEHRERCHCEEQPGPQAPV
ncbi:MAG: hypothetical protein IKJ55_02790 [Clostridia bacterium]|nr:hypothetical protein [Clostridia bacterium]